MADGIRHIINQHINAPGDDFGAWADDDSDTVIAPAVYTATDGSGTTAIWAGANGGMAIPIPVGALGQKVRIEWKLRGFGGSSDDYMGWYIDDVVVRTP